MRIEFEDHGQDFLWWDIDPATGKVTDCGPFQAWMWADGKRHVELESIEVGQRPFCYKDEKEAAEKVGICLNYCVTEVTP